MIDPNDPYGYLRHQRLKTVGHIAGLRRRALLAKMVWAVLFLTGLAIAFAMIMVFHWSDGFAGS
jgi:dolichol kinase